MRSCRNYVFWIIWICFKIFFSLSLSLSLLFFLYVLESVYVGDLNLQYAISVILLWLDYDFLFNTWLCLHNLGKLMDAGELTEKEIIRQERNSGVISNRVREIQVGTFTSFHWEDLYLLATKWGKSRVVLSLPFIEKISTTFTWKHKGNSSLLHSDQVMISVLWFLAIGWCFIWCLWTFVWIWQQHFKSSGKH